MFVGRLKRFSLLSLLGIGLSLQMSCTPYYDDLNPTCVDITDEVIDAGIFLSLQVLRPNLPLKFIEDYESKCYSLQDDGTIDEMYDYYDNGYTYVSSMYKSSWECSDDKFMLYMDEDIYEIKIKKTIDECIGLSYIKGILRIEALLCNCKVFGY